MDPRTYGPFSCNMGTCGPGSPSCNTRTYGPSCNTRTYGPEDIWILWGHEDIGTVAQHRHGTRAPSEHRTVLTIQEYNEESFVDKDTIEPHFAFQRLHAAIENNMGTEKPENSVHGWIVYIVPAPMLSEEDANPFPGSSDKCNTDFVPDFSEIEVAMGAFYKQGLEASNHIGIFRPKWGRKTKTSLAPLLHAFASKVMDLQAVNAPQPTVDSDAASSTSNNLQSSLKRITRMETAPRQVAPDYNSHIFFIHTHIA